MTNTQLISSVDICDPLELQDTIAIEVVVTLSNGEQRWCFVSTPDAMKQFGDWIDGTRIRFHHGAEHMIVIAAPLTEDLISAALNTVDREGNILRCTRPCTDM